MFKPRKGFTLIELLVVISIIGLLSSIVLASLNTARSKARDAKRMSDIKEISTALELYYNDHNAYPPSPTDWTDGWSLGAHWIDGTGALAQALKPFLTKLPTDPVNVDVYCFGLGAHTYFYQSFDSGQGYGIYAALENVPSPVGPDPNGYTCCSAGAPNTCAFKASNGGIGIVVRK